MAVTENAAEDLGLRPIEEFDGLFDVWPRGRRLERVRGASESYKQRFKAQGQVTAVRIDVRSGLIEGAASPRGMTAYAIGR